MKEFYPINDFIHKYIALLLLLIVGCTEDPVKEKIDPFDKEDIKTLMIRASVWQLDHPNPRIDNIDEIWERSVLYLGVMASYRVTGQSELLLASENWAASQGYKVGSESRYFHADDEVIGQVYLELYKETADTVYLKEIVKRSSEVVNLSKQGRELWSWCDALFMTPPLISGIAELTNDNEKYVKLDQKWWDVYDHLYDPSFDLFYRDARYLDTLNAYGNKIFWSRGNGWVLAGLARMLQHWDDSDPTKQKYEDLFKRMSASIVKRQHGDGLWRTNLVDELEFPEPETSGTAFFIYAIAWGINQGLLEENVYLKTIHKGWRGLVNAVSDEGKLGWVQQPYHEPGIVYPDRNEEYATGALLLAAEEVFFLLETGKL